ncbi:MAG: hypothetical protein ACLGIR_13745 [Actinomycetes bacterium]
MTTTLTRGAVLALAVALSALLGAALGLPAAWPVALAGAVLLAPGRPSLARIGSLAAGAVIGIVALAFQAAVLPAVAASEAISAVVAIAAVTLVSAVSGNRLPLWAGVVGVALFQAVYLPVFEASPTTFLADAPAALVTTVLALAIGAVAATAADLMTPNAPADDRELTAAADDLRLVLHIPDETSATTAAVDGATAEGTR